MNGTAARAWGNQCSVRGIGGFELARAKKSEGSRFGRWAGRVLGIEQRNKADEDDENAHDENMIYTGNLEPRQSGRRISCEDKEEHPQTNAFQIAKISLGWFTTDGPVRSR